MAKKKIFKLIDEVELFLRNHKVLRDSDERLMANIWAKYIGTDSIKFLNAADILKMLAKDELPSYESISRCRRKLQEEFSTLRGNKWEKRHAIAKEEVKKEITALTKKIREIKKREGYDMFVSTPYPVGFEYRKERK